MKKLEFMPMENNDLYALKSAEQSRFTVLIRLKTQLISLCRLPKNSLAYPPYS